MSHIKVTRTVITTLLGLAVVGGTTSAFAASFLDLTSITPGPAGSFTGTLGPVVVNGAITTPAAGGGYVFNAVAGPTSYESSTIDNSSPQYSYADIYTPSIPATDRVGYTSFAGSNPATITITFSSPVTNPVFHIANLDGAIYDFTPTAGLGGLVLLSGNGGADNDGLKVTGNVIMDANPATGVGQNPNTHPLITGARSGYGSVEIAGTFTSLTILVTNTGNGDGGSFTLSAASDSFQVKYVANLAAGDSVIDITNTGALSAGLASGTTAATTGAICANVYAFTPDEQLVSCCSCPVTPNGLVSLSAKNDLASNTLTPAVPTALVVKLLATLPVAGSCNNSAAAVTTESLVPGMIAFGTTIHAAPGTPTAYGVTETRFSVATLSTGELNRLGTLCNFIVANGSGFGVCRSCRLGGLGSTRQ